MNLDEFIEDLKSLIYIYESARSGGIIDQEIQMWRQDFLDKKNQNFDNKYIQELFKCTPSHEMVGKSPQKLYKEIVDSLKRKDNED